MNSFDERDIWGGPESFTEHLFRVTGAHWGYWVALGFTIGFTLVGML